MEEKQVARATAEACRSLGSVLGGMVVKLGGPGWSECIVIK